MFVNEKEGLKFYFSEKYHPKMYHGQLNPNHDSASQLLLAFKDGYDSGLAYYLTRGIELVDYLCANYKIDGVVIIPSHTEFKYSESMLVLVKEVTDKSGLEDLHLSLRRVYTIDKLAKGGDRSINNHIKSINVISENVKGKNILILDDVITTGGSMIACKKILLSARVKSVVCAALVETVWESY